MKEIFLELPLPAGGMVAVVVDGMREGAVGYEQTSGGSDGDGSGGGGCGAEVALVRRGG